jgi:glycerophosphoryl diester phosphodiesterase
MAPLIIAHRTCPLQAPENSLAGLRAAAEQQVDGVEIDLRMSLDQRPFILHDWSMRRTTGWPLPLELTPSLLVRKLRLQDTEERLPSLDEVFETLAPGVVLAVDVKSPWAVVPLMRQIKRRGMEKRVLVWCTSAWAVRYAVRSAPDVEVAYLKDVREPEAKRDFIAKARLMGAKAISAHWLAIDAEFVAAAHALGLKVYSFHERFELTPEKLTSGLDGLITDVMAEARAAIGAAEV